MTYRQVSDGLSGTALSNVIVRTQDGVHIPADPLNRDWRAYQDWLAAGNVPDGAPAPPAPETFSGNQWALAVGDLGLASALLDALAASKAKDRHRYGFIGRDTPLRPDDPLLARICALGGRALDLPAIVAHARTMPAG